MPNYEVEFSGYRANPSLRDLQRFTESEPALDPLLDEYFADNTTIESLYLADQVKEAMAPALDEVVIDLRESKPEEEFALAAVASANEDSGSIFSRPKPAPGSMTEAVAARIIRTGHPNPPKDPPSKSSGPSDQSDKLRALFGDDSPVKEKPTIPDHVELDFSSPEEPEVEFFQAFAPTIEESESQVSQKHSHRRPRRHRKALEHSEVETTDVEPKIAFFKRVLQKIKPQRQTKEYYYPEDEYRVEKRRKRVLVGIGVGAVALIGLGAAIGFGGTAPQGENAETPTTLGARRAPVTSIAPIRVNEPTLITIDKYTNFYNLDHMATAQDIKDYDKAFGDMLKWYAENPGGDLINALQNFES